MIGRFSTEGDIKIRLCEQTDLLNLEWFGTFTDYREVFWQTFERQEKNEVVWLVAEFNHFPVGQLCVDLTKRCEDSIGVLWAFRVLPPFQGMSIGSHLLDSAEKLLKKKVARIKQQTYEITPGEAFLAKQS